MSDLYLPCVELETGPNPIGSVIWLHGLGADGHDFEAIVPELRLPKSLALRFVFPHAPVMPVTMNGGFPMRAWYDIAVLDFNHRKSEDERGIRVSESQLRKLIERENARGIPSDKIVIAGFSQGGAIALHSALRYPEPLAGVLALSTYLPLQDKADGEKLAANRQTPIFMAHGTADPIVPLTAGESSAERLNALGFSVDFHRYPMPHSVHPQEITEISAWLQGRFRA